MKRPRLAITMGDPAGVGPETIAGAWCETTTHELGQFVVAGHPQVMRRAVELIGANIEVLTVDSADQVDSGPDVMPCLPCVSPDAADVPAARIDRRGGQAAYDALIEATRLAQAGQIAGLVTAPLHKAALHAAGHRYPGHTELLAELCGVEQFAMMLYLPPGKRVLSPHGLGVAHVTLHMALRDVFEHLTVDAIVSKSRLANTVMRYLGSDPTAQPRIGVCALNPHGGEEGLFGDEEIQTIRPAVERCVAAGLTVAGPFPTDTLMVRAAAGEFDAVVAMYHDQGHIALKLLDMHRAVNITLGLPIIRTSVAHGTAFDLAWQGKARTTGMVEAIRAAAKLAGPGTRLSW